MSDQDVIDHIHRYAEWLEASSALDLSPPDDPAELDEADELVAIESVGSGGSHSGRLLAIAAAVVLCLGAVWVLRPTPSEADFVLASASDTPVELYVLPDPFDPNVATGAYVRGVRSATSELGSQIVTVGVRNGDTYSDLATIRNGPVFEGLGTPSNVELDSGPAQLYSDVFTMITQQRGQTTLTVTTQENRGDYAGSILDSIQISDDGSISLAANAEFEIIETITIDGEVVDFSTSFNINAPALTNDSEAIVVETAASPSPLIGVGFIGGDLSATRIQSVDGWVVTRLDVDGEWNGIAWQATPSAIVTVSGHAPLEAIKEVAESLIIVDTETWQAAFPDYQGE